MSAPLLELRNLVVRYGSITALHGISLTLAAGELVTLLGANGAGKSTTLRAISGLNHPTSGEIWFDGRRIDRLPPEKVNKAGIAQVPEGRRVFPYMTVLENLEMGAYLRRDGDGMRKDLESVYEHFPILKERGKQLAGTLSGGQQQMLAMGRALMSNPSLLLMDEPSLGLSPLLCQEIARIIKEIHERGKTIVLVEQNARLALNLAEKGYVLETGRVALEGRASELRDNQDVKRMYLGG